MAQNIGFHKSLFMFCSLTLEIHQSVQALSAKVIVEANGSPFALSLRLEAKG